MISRITRLFRRPLRVQLTAPPEKAAAALHGLANMLNRRRDLDGTRVRIDLTIRHQQPKRGARR